MSVQGKLRNAIGPRIPSCAVLVFVVVCGLAAPAGADDRSVPAEFVDAPSEHQLVGQSLPASSVRLGVWDRAHERNHTVVKSAFSDLITGATRSTVEVLCDGRKTALGTITHADGYILTKHSELTGKEIVCRLKDRRSLPAEVVGVHQATDLAMLRVQADGLQPVSFSQEGPPPIGSWLATPGLEDLPLAIGVVSAPPRKMAAPIGVLGVMLGDAPAGPSVEEVLPGSSALRAGLKATDVIVRVNDTRTASRRALVEAIRGHHPGETVLLHVLRGQKTELITARLLARTGNPSPGSLDFQNRMGGRISNRRTGFPRVLQHDSVLRPSDCGGPLVDLDGEVVGINIARAGRVASLALPASVVLGLLDDLKSGKLAPPRWSARLWSSQRDVLATRILSLETSLREAERLRDEAQQQLLKSETVVRRALVEQAAAELRKVDAQQDVVKRVRAEAERMAAERAVFMAEGPFEDARRDIEAATKTIRDIRLALAAARREEAKWVEETIAP
jgi:serine protease Do